MDKSKWGVHESHCCVAHGCKYGDPDCPVVNKQTKQQYLCEECDFEGIKTVEEAELKVDGFAKLNPNKMYAKIQGIGIEKDKIVIINGYKFSGDVIILFLLKGEEQTVFSERVTLLQKTI